jgi:RHS repeat-associated protein
MRLFPHWVLILVSLWTAQVAGMARELTCETVTSGLRATRNLAAGPWHGFVPYGLSTTQLPALQVKFLEKRLTWDFSGQYTTNDGTTAVDNSGWFQSEAMLRINEDGASVADSFVVTAGENGTEDSPGRFTGTGFDWCCRTFEWEAELWGQGTATGGAIHYYTVNTVDRFFDYYQSPNTWVTNSSTSMPVGFDTPYPIIDGLVESPTQLSKSEQWSLALWLQAHGTAEGVETLSEEYTREEYRDWLMGKLIATNRHEVFEVAVGSFDVESDASGGSVQVIENLKLFVLGVKDRKYQVTATKQVTRNNGAVSTSEVSRTITGAGPETEAYAEIPAEPPPAEGGTITYCCTRATEVGLGMDSPDTSGGVPGASSLSGLPDGSASGLGGCSSCGGSSGNINGHTGVGFNVPLGFGSGGTDAGSAEWQVSMPSPDALDKSWVRTPAVEGLTAWEDSNKTHLLSDQAVVTITNNAGGGFTLRTYGRSAMFSTNASGVTLAPGAVPRLVVQVEPEIAGVTDGRRIKVTQTPAGGTPRITYFRATQGLPAGVTEWVVTDAANLIEYRWRQEMGEEFARTSRIEWRWPGTTNVVSSETSHFIRGPRGEVVSWQTSGIGSETRTNLFEYFEFTGLPAKEGRLKVARQWDGSWVEFDYDALGRKILEIRPWDDGAHAAGSVVRRTTIDYTPIGGSGDTGSVAFERSSRTETDAIGSSLTGYRVVAVRWRVHAADHVREIEAATPGAAWDDPANRVTTRYHRPAAHPQAGDVWKIVHADGRMSLITRSSAGSTNTVTTTEGKPNAGGTAIVDGVASTVVRGTFGETLAQTNFVIVNSVLTPTSILVHENFDEFRRYGRERYLDGTYADRDFACCGIDSKTDRDGVTSTLIRDAALRVVGRYRLGILETNLLDPAGNVLREVRVGTNGVAMTLVSRGYDSTGTLRAETNALGGVTRWGWHHATNGAVLLTRTNPAGAVRVELYARDGRLRQIGGNEAAPVRFEYQTDSRDVGLGTAEDVLVERTILLNANGADTAETTSLFKDIHGQVRLILRGASAEHQARYNRLGQRVWEKDADGVVSLYRYNGVGDWESTATDVDPSNTTFDADGNPSIDFANDRVVQRLRDVTNHLSQTVERTRWYELPVAGSSTTTNLIREHLLKMDGLQSWTIERGLTRSRQTSFNPATQTRTETVTAPDNSYRIDVFVAGRPISSTEFSSSGSQVSRVTYAYDPHGRVLSATDARQGTTTVGYNAADLVATHTEPSAGTGAGSPVTSITYDNALRPVQLVRPDGTVVTNEYYASGLLRRLTGSQVLPTEFEYDVQGRQTALISWQSFTAGTGKATNRWEFDSERGWLTARRYPDGTATRYEYTPGGRLRTQIWARSGVTNRLRYGFEEGGSAPATGDLRRIDYDGEVDLDGAAIGRNSRFEYDRLGRLTAEQQVSATSGAVLTRVEYQLNEAGQRTNEVWTAGPLANRSVARTYDNVRRVTNLVARLSGSPFLNIGYGYDAAGRLSLVQDGSLSAAYSYEPNSHLASQILFKSGSTVIANTTRKFDRLDRILSQTTAGTATSGSTLLGVDYDYNHLGQRTEARYLDGTYWLYAYDRLGQVTSARHFWADGTAVLGQQFSYGYDDSGNRTSDGRGGDALGQLRLTTYVNNVFDQPTAVANHRHSEVQGAAQATAAVTVNGTSAERQGEYFRRELTAPGIQPAWQNVDVSVTGGTSITGRKTYVPPQAEAIAHDHDGNLTADGRWEFGWDGENRLVDIRTRAQAHTNGVPRQRVRFDYDASGRVLERREFRWEAGTWTNNLTTRYLYDGWQCIAEFSGSGATRRTHVWGLDISESRRGAGGLGGLLWLNTATNGTHVAAYDGNGSVLGLIGTTGQVTARYEYGPFGELLRMSGDALAADNPWRWGTKRVDPTTDLVHYEYRVYSPRLGRWLSRDPIGEAGGRNLYAFAGNDPVNSQDVLGLDGGAGGVLGELFDGNKTIPDKLGALETFKRTAELALLACACSGTDFWKGLGSGAWDGVTGLWDAAVFASKLTNPVSGSILAYEMAPAVAMLLEMAQNEEFVELIKVLAPEVAAVLTLPPGSPEWCRSIGSLYGGAAFELLLLILAPELEPAKLAALAGKLGPRIGKAADDVAELIAKARKLVKEPKCFVAGTLVATAIGVVPIESIRAGDLVWARDEVTGEIRLCEVAETYCRESAPIVEVIAGGELIATTPEHPFWVQDHGWKAAGDLQVGDRLVTLSGESVVVEDIRRRPVPEPVYNLQVSGLHTYFVGLAGVWVHNSCDLPGRNGAFRDAKRAADLPMNSRPTVSYEWIRDHPGVQGRKYTFVKPDGSIVTIREHSLGHPISGQGPHFNVEIRAPGGGPKLPLPGGGDGHHYYNP